MRRDTRKWHMLKLAPNDGRVRETVCGRVSNGGGIGVQVLQFASIGGDFIGVEEPGAVTCRKCLAAMERERGA